MSDEIKLKEAFEREKPKILEKIGTIIMAQAIEFAPVDTGNLRRTMFYDVIVDDVIVGNNSEYAPYVEYGTGLYAEGGPTPAGENGWWFRVESDTPAMRESGMLRVEGKDGGIYYYTHGQYPQPFLRPALDETKKDILEIVIEGIETVIREELNGKYL